MIEPDAFILMECPNCGKHHANTLAHVKARWDEPFTCESGCGIVMKLDREELIAVLDAPSPATPIIAKMHQID